MKNTENVENKQFKYKRSQLKFRHLQVGMNVIHFVIFRNDCSKA
jgi:hypothetical protein